MLQAVLTLAGAYVVGSIPFSYLVARAFGVTDVRTVGSGNVGATNVMRSAGKGPGIAALILDALKGALATGTASRLFPGSEWLPALAAVAAVLGHVFPVWLGFRGGKGVATGAGAFLPLAPVATGTAAVVFVLVLLLGRYVSLGSMASAAALAAVAFLSGSPRPVAICAAAVALLVIVKHKANIERLLAGTENRLGARR
jgi:acyl phosphate:glycerol-3-phosphate acyltransferase